MSKWLSLVAVFGLIAGCSSPAQNPAADGDHQPIPGYSTGPKDAINEFRDGQNVSLFGSWNVADFYGHIDQEFGYTNCVGYRIAEIEPIRVQVTAAWTSGGPHEERMQVFHFFKSDNSPRYGTNYTVGTSPIVHEFDVMPANGTMALTFGVDPAGEVPIGFGTVLNVALDIKITYRGEQNWGSALHYTCGRQFG